jgi:hypothetical protein
VRRQLGPEAISSEAAPPVRLRRSPFVSRQLASLPARGAAATLASAEPLKASTAGNVPPASLTGAELLKGQRANATKQGATPGKAARPAAEEAPTVRHRMHVGLAAA